MTLFSLTIVLCKGPAEDMFGLLVNVVWTLVTLDVRFSTHRLLLLFCGLIRKSQLHQTQLLPRRHEFNNE